MRHIRGALLEAGFDGVEAHAGAEVMGTPEAVRAIATGLATGAQGPGFMGPVLLSLIWRETFVPVGAEPIDTEALVTQHLDALLEGMLLRETARA